MFLTVMFVGDIERPQHITANLIKESDSRGCMILLGWTPPINLASEDIAHYKVYVDENRGAHSVSVSAVSRCGHEGQRSPIIILKGVCDSI